MYVDIRVLFTQGLLWAIPYVLELTVRLETDLGIRGLTEFPGWPGTPSSEPLSVTDRLAKSTNAAWLLNPCL